MQHKNVKLDREKIYTHAQKLYHAGTLEELILRLTLDLGKTKSTFDRRCRNGWPLEAVLALCYLFGCEPEELK